MHSNFAMVPFASHRISVSMSGNAASIRAIVRRRSEVLYIQIKFSSSTLKFMTITTELRMTQKLLPIVKMLLNKKGD